MKKMQCEVCGGTEIKKVGDGIFECQSCGIQYSSEEVKKLLVEITGKVKIDHSEEVENSIKRAQQFEQAGDDAKAAQYYHAALDMDADNAIAQQRVQEIAQQQELSDYFIVEADVDPQENVRNFLDQLSSTDNMACDIYKEIAIKSVTEKYMTFYFMKGKYQIDWSATACHTYYENQTVYKRQYDSRLGRHVEKPVTEKVQRVNYVPQNGRYITDAEELMLASDNLAAALTMDKDRVKRHLVASFESQQDGKYSTYKVQKLNGRQLQKENGKYFYNGMELDAEADSRVYAENKKRLHDNAGQRALPAIENQIGGDYYENFNATQKTLSESTVCVCLPVQVIEYTYKGVTFAAVSDLLSHTSTIPMAYPCDTEMAKAMEGLETQKEVAQKNPGLWGGLITMGLGLFGVFLLSLNFGEVFQQLPFWTFALMIGGLVWLVSGAILRKVRGQKFANNAERIKQTMFEPRVKALETGKELFFKAYTDYASVEKAAADMDCMAIQRVTCQISEAGVIRKKMAYITNTAEEDDTTAVLDAGIEQLKKSRKIGIVVAIVAGLVLGGLGVLFLNLADMSGHIHTIAGGVYWVLILGGFAEAAFGWAIVMGNRNEKINQLKAAREAYLLRKQIGEAFQNTEEATESRNALLRQWDEDRIEDTVDSIRQKAAQKGWKPSKLQKILGIVAGAVAVAAVAAILIEAGICKSEAKPYEESLVGRTFRCVDTYGDTTVYTYTFGENNTVEYHSETIDLITNEVTYSYDYEERYVVHYDPISGEMYLYIDRVRCEIYVHEGTTEISNFEGWVGEFYEVKE